MKLIVRLLCLLVFLTAFSSNVLGQYNKLGWEGGIYGGAAIGLNESDWRPWKLQGRVSVGFPIIDRLQFEFGGGGVTNEGDGYKSSIIPLDVRLRLCPFYAEKVIPYLYAGIGTLHYETTVYPETAYPDVDKSAWTGFLPYGAGIEFILTDMVSFEITGGSNYTFTDYINPIKVAKVDSYAGLMAGIRVRLESGDVDRDHDGLTDKMEKEIGTDPKNPDTDGDGLSDGAEYNTYKTSPLKADTDGDGLKDGEEINTYHTNANVADTDGDGLNDQTELMTTKTDPLKADTDGDGLTDGQEVNKYKTDPLKADTDGDKLKDGEEVLTYKTDPLLADTDKGTVDDGTEVKRGTNPLDPSDDVPKKKEVLEIKETKRIVLEGVTFNTGSSELLPASEEVLTKALNTLEDNPQIRVEIQGYTDNKGNQDKNLKLSQARAEAVKNWLVNKGIKADRLTAKGYGPDNPIASNDTPEGRSQNRRIEFVVQ
jgi:outer membrane protein OmpA-like peptidoglycan-associated protein